MSCLYSSWPVFIGPQSGPQKWCVSVWYACQPGNYEDKTFINLDLEKVLPLVVGWTGEIWEPPGPVGREVESPFMNRGIIVLYPPLLVPLSFYRI